MTYLCRKQFDPQLEALRTKGLLENSLITNDWIARLIKKTSVIHAGFLFEDLKTLQDLCLYISESQSKVTDAGWLSFGYHLGLNPTLLKVIKHNNFINEDPCYNVLLAYVQYEYASIGKIIEALNLMGRIDVLSRIKNSINDLTDLILNCNSNLNNNSTEDASDYGSLPVSEGSQSCDNSFSSFVNELFVRPKVIPPAPFIFQNIKGNPEVTSRKIQEAVKCATADSMTSCTSVSCVKNQSSSDLNCSDDLKNRVLLNNDCLNEKSLANSDKNSPKERTKPNTNSRKKEKYGLKILLTFAEDGETYAEEIAKIFRKKLEDYPSIGVLILGEHAERVSMDPQQFIEGAFHQVDYVCPVLTIGYYELITKQKKTNSLSYKHFDAMYVPYIYRLMNSYFVANNCLNDKIRCIIPENIFRQECFTFLSTNPIFGAWVNISEVEDLAVRLLKSIKNVKCWH
ncbi:hypothetical protein RUM43_007328 [Polyplax serrata]|uniref:Death domain-containing protein n=1 Tax=Polyplax serrata TaxID=468196 RepID=A0AAN8Q5X1_POLSC